jgi:hypothetical protein
MSLKLRDDYIMAIPTQLYRERKTKRRVKDVQDWCAGLSAEENQRQGQGICLTGLTIGPAECVNLTVTAFSAIG